MKKSNGLANSIIFVSCLALGALLLHTSTLDTFCLLICRGALLVATIFIISMVFIQAVMDICRNNRD